MGTEEAVDYEFWKDSVYPGHPLVIGVAIMRLYPSLDAAEKRRDSGFGSAVSDHRVWGSGCAVYTALNALELALTASPDDGIARCDDYWEHMGGHRETNPAGYLDGKARAEAHKAEWLRRVANWSIGAR